jgi:VanZ family protein
MQLLTKLISNKQLSLCLLILIGITIPALSLFNISDLPKLEIQSADKLYHFIAYASLSFSVALHYRNYREKNISLKSFSGIFFLTILFGIIIEVLQESLTTYRTFDYFDMLANTLGSLTGLVIISVLLQFLKINKQSH